MSEYRRFEGAPDFQEEYQSIYGEMDGRLRNPKNEKWGSAGPLSPRLWEPCFCANCGAKGGYVTKDTPILYQCNDCFFRMGPLPLPRLDYVSHA